MDEKMLIEQELTALKLQLNQEKQERANLEKELLSKEETVIKMEGEMQKKESQYKYEIKALNDKLANISQQYNNEELQKEYDKLKKEKNELQDKINKLISTENGFKKKISDTEQIITDMVSDSDKLKVENEQLKQHLATLELSFSDLHSKYERCKDIIVGLKKNEETLVESLEKFKEGARKYEERYDMLKSHATAQLEKANKDLAVIKKEHVTEVSKLSNMLKCLEIKNGSIQQALDQKTKECEALSALCDEITGTIPH